MPPAQSRPAQRWLSCSRTLKPGVSPDAVEPADGNQRGHGDVGRARHRTGDRARRAAVRVRALDEQPLARDLERRRGGAVLGGLFIGVTRRIVGRHEDLRFGTLEAADAKKAILIVAVMTVHSFSEGVGVGVAYGGGAALGIFITVAIAIHNIPEGLAISLVLVPRGTSVRAAAGWSIFTSLPQPLVAAPAFLFVEAFRPFLPVGFGFAAGAMTWLVFAELVTDARRELTARPFWAWLGGSFAGCRCCSSRCCRADPRYRCGGRKVVVW
jgi:zinc transporter ZupT